LPNEQIVTIEQRATAPSDLDVRQNYCLVQHNSERLRSTSDAAICDASMKLAATITREKNQTGFTFDFMS
jgi:hypothetical protein